MSGCASRWSRQGRELVDGRVVARPSSRGRARRCSRRWPRAVRARSPSSAGPAAPTRTPTPGPSWPRACSAPTTSTPSSATASIPRSCSALPQSHDRRGLRGPHRRAARPRPQGGAAGPVPAAARRGREAPHPARRAGRPRHRPHALHVEEPAAPPGRAGRRCARSLLDPRAGARRHRRHRRRRVADDPRAARPRATWSWSSDGRRPGRVGRPSPTTPSPSCCARLAGGHVPGRPAAGQRQRRPRHGSRARAACRAASSWPRRRTRCGRAGRRCRRSRASTPAGILRAAADGRIDCLVLLGADPVVRLPRPRPGPARPRRRRHGHRRRHLPQRVLPPGRRGAGRRRLRREGRHHHQPRGAGQRRSPSRSRRSAPPTPTGSSPPTWPHRLGHDLGLARSRRSGTSSGRCRRATPPCRRPSSPARPRWRRDTARRAAPSPSPTPAPPRRR